MVTPIFALALHRAFDKAPLRLEVIPEAERTQRASATNNGDLFHNLKRKYSH
jgi:hypothetical protein